MLKRQLYKGVIFDFNGTLFWDTAYHNKAWDLFLERHDIRLTDEEKDRIIHGRNNQEIFNSLFNTDPDTKKLHELILEKESIYQEICRAHKKELAPGALDFLDFLKNLHVPFTLATASGKENIDFYFRHLELDKWFDIGKIVYNDGSFKGKPEPHIFLKAANLLDLAPRDLVVFEDSLMGIRAAERAGIGRIIVVQSTKTPHVVRSHDGIRHFNEVERTLFVP